MKQKTHNNSLRGVLIAGAIGGAFPCVLRAAQVLVGQAQADDGPFVISYWSGTLLFALLGLGTAWIFNEENVRKAFLLGIGLPSFLQLQVAQNDQGLGSVAIELMPQFATQVYAQEVQRFSVETLPVPNRSIVVKSNTTLPFDIHFSDMSGQQIGTVKWNRQNTIFHVPDTAAYISFGKSGTTSEKAKLTRDPRAIMGFDVKITEKSRYGFWQALGARAHLKRAIKVKQATLPTLERGTNGVIYLGKKTQDGWITPYMTFDGDEPRKGAIGHLKYPIPIKSSQGARDDWPIIAPIGSQLEIVELLMDSNDYYTAVVKIPDSSDEQTVEKLKGGPVKRVP